MEISSVRFRNFKALREFEIRLNQMNVLVGPNNAGKSTIIGAFRVLQAGLRRARAKSPVAVALGSQLLPGYQLGPDDVPISLENAHTDYGGDDSTVEFFVGSGESFLLIFSDTGGCRMFVRSTTRPPTDPKSFRTRYPLQLGIIPVLGPVEHDEPVLQRETVQAALSTPRASRHFRNYWYHNPDSFDLFKSLVSKTWPEMEIRKPELNAGPKGPILSMFCGEGRIDRELYWIGSGFQIWCQLLTHVIRSSGADLLIVDEPEIYLHPDMQRQLLSLFRQAGPSLLLATHSSELAAEAEPTDILLINKKFKNAQRLRNVEALQSALDYLGSGHNIALAHLARTRRLLFVEGDDFRLIRKFASRAGFDALASGLDIVPVALGGFGQWERVNAAHWTFRNALGQPILLGAIFDRDYFCCEEIDEIEGKLKASADLLYIHRQKEIENFFLIPQVLDRCVKRALADRAKRNAAQTVSDVNTHAMIAGIAEEMRAETESQLVGKAIDFHRRSGVKINNATITKNILSTVNERWKTLEGRLTLISGKELFGKFNKALQQEAGVSLTPAGVIINIRREEMAEDLVDMLKALDTFRQKPVPA